MELPQSPVHHAIPKFLLGGGEMSDLIRKFDWSKTSVGSFENWPAALKTVLNTILKSKFPMFLWWGDELIQFYNDAYRPALGNNGKHPTALGQKGEDCWVEIWPAIGPLISAVMYKDESIWREDQLIPIYRNGGLEDVYWTFSYSPVNDEDGKVGGVLVVCNETTRQVNLVNRLKQSEQRFQTLIHQATVGTVVLVGSEMTVDIVNDTYARLFDRTRGELLGKPFMDVIPQLNSIVLIEHLARVRSSGESFFLSEDAFLTTRQGQPHTNYYNYSYVPLPDADGQNYGIICTVTDVTEQVVARQKVEEAEVKTRLAIESADLGTYEINLLTNDMKTTDRFNEIWGVDHSVSRSEFVSYIHPEYIPIRQKAHAESLKTGHLHYEAKLVWKDRSEHWVRVKGKVIYDENGDAATLLGVIQDITEQKQSAANLSKLVIEQTQELLLKNTALKESEERYHRMVDEVEDYAILFLDRSGIVQNWNKGAEKIKGYKRDEIIGKSFTQFYLPQDRESGLPERLIAQAVQYGKALQEGLRLRKDGTTFWGSIVITALHDKDNNVVGFSKVTRDLTERKLAEEKIQQYTEALEFQNNELKQFAFVASHDMKEPLRKIIFNTAYLADRINDRLNNKEKEALTRSANAAKRMKVLIEDILSYSQTSFGDYSFETVDLNTIVQDVITNLQENFDEVGVVVESSTMPVITGIPHQLAQLFDNLLNNAVKYRHADRKLHLTLAYQKVKSAEFNADMQNHDYHKISVADNGIGFEPGNEEKIFELFYRLKDRKEYPGSGIGLSICRKIVQNHKGAIKAIAKEGQGATFEIYLPV